ncbi:hypothetical protein [Psychroserpens damuponensis]|uniref:hypothetical protein n=1 Tax=Psychroserpens damuponensis TaxID=943936 RepID=UPI00058B6C7A|nr:hypothetical protein [Psychroserpens damuponensis]
MTEENIKKSWRNLLIPICIGIIIFLVALYFNRFGSKRPTPQTISLFGCVLGLIFIIFPGIRMIKFKTFLKQHNKH